MTAAAPPGELDTVGNTRSFNYGKVFLYCEI
jgi:hypothetical protein